MMLLLLAKVLNCGHKTDKNGDHIGNYGISKEQYGREDKLESVYHFRFKFVQEWMFKKLDKKYPIQFCMHVLYNDRVYKKTRG